MKNIKYIAIAALALTATSCANFLEEEPKGQMVTENFFQTSADLELALNAMYKQVASAQSSGNNAIVQLQGDDITISNDKKYAYAAADAFKQPSQFEGVEALWSGEYRVIQAANFVIDNADRVDADKQTINNAKGNAMFWRACAYFELVRVFGPLPVNPHNEAIFDTPMTSVTGIYDMIITDLETADSYNLPTTWKGEKYGNTDGCNYWVTRQAVKAALAAVYMARAGWPFYTSDTDNSTERIEWYSKAAEKAREVIDGVNNKTFDNQMESDWKMVYPYGNNWSKEQLITISYFGTYGTMGEMNSNLYISQYSLRQLLEQFQGGWGDYLGERLWWSKYPEGPRKQVVYEPQINTATADGETGLNMMVDWWATNNKKEYQTGGNNNVVGVYHPTFGIMITNTVSESDKTPSSEPYDCTKPAYIGQQIPQNHRYIRYPEVICWYAEAVGRGGTTKKGGDETLAQTELQKVINRAYTTPKSVIGLTGKELAEAAYDEHGYEVTGYPIALVTRRADQFRMNRLKKAWEYRRGEQNDVLVPANTPTLGTYVKSVKLPGERFPTNMLCQLSYTLDYDVKIPETLPVAETWDDVESMYHPYPPTEQVKNPNIKRISAFN